jgi:hypothetical protein
MGGDGGDGLGGAIPRHGTKDKIDCDSPKGNQNARRCEFARFSKSREYSYRLQGTLAQTAVDDVKRLY